MGLPNAGKSSLLNALAGYDRAIVTDIPGTTRDTVEETVTCGGTLLRLIDTAGIHDTADAVEQLGVERSRKAAETADLVIAVADGSQTPPTVDEDILALAAQAPHWILAVSKDDLNPAVKTAVWQLPKGLREPDALVSFNSVAPGGLDALVDAIQGCFPAGDACRSRFPADQRPAGVRRPPEPGGRPAGIVRPGRRPDPRRSPHRRGGGPGSRGGTNGPHRQGGDRRRGVQPFLRGKITIFVFPCLSSCFP